MAAGEVQQTLRRTADELAAAMYVVFQAGASVDDILDELKQAGVDGAPDGLRYSVPRSQMDYEMLWLSISVASDKILAVLADVRARLTKYAGMTDVDRDAAFKEKAFSCAIECLYYIRSGEDSAAIIYRQLEERARLNHSALLEDYPRHCLLAHHDALLTLSLLNRLIDGIVAKQKALFEQLTLKEGQNPKVAPL